MFQNDLFYEWYIAHILDRPAINEIEFVTTIQPPQRCYTSLPVRSKDISCKILNLYTKSKKKNWKRPV